MSRTHINSIDLETLQLARREAEDAGLRFESEALEIVIRHRIGAFYDSPTAPSLRIQSAKYMAERCDKILDA